MILPKLDLETIFFMVLPQHLSEVGGRFREKSTRTLVKMMTFMNAPKL